MQGPLLSRGSGLHSRGPRGRQALRPPKGGPSPHRHLPHLLSSSVFTLPDSQQQLPSSRSKEALALLGPQGLHGDMSTWDHPYKKKNPFCAFPRSEGSWPCITARAGSLPGGSGLLCHKAGPLGPGLPLLGHSQPQGNCIPFIPFPSVLSNFKQGFRLEISAERPQSLGLHDLLEHFPQTTLHAGGTLGFKILFLLERVRLLPCDILF